MNYPLANVVECEAVVAGLNNDLPLPVRISVKCLPAPGNQVRALCKWPRLTAQGWRSDGEYYWSEVEVRSDGVYITMI